MTRPPDPWYPWDEPPDAKPIDTAPVDKSLLLWWRPINDDNPAAECWVVGQVSAHKAGTWWDGRKGEYQDLWHITHWMCLPQSPRK